MPEANDRQRVRILCQCGCNRSLVLPLANVLPGDFYACDLNRVGLNSSKFIPLAPGRMRITTVFKGRDFFRIRDILPDQECVQEHWASWEVWAERVAFVVCWTKPKNLRVDRSFMSELKMGWCSTRRFRSG